MRKLMVLFVAAVALFAFTVPAMAQAQWSFYGSARMYTSWQDRDKDTFGAGVLGAPATPFDDSDLLWGLQSNSRIGANVKAGDIGGRFEYGTGINLRLLYGTWNFGAGTLLVGQDYTPLFFPTSDQCGLPVGGGDCGLVFWGFLYTGRVPQLKLTMGGFQLALLDPAPAANKVGGAEQDTKLPRIEAAYTFNLGSAAIHIGGGYKSYDDVVIVAGAEREYGVKAWVGTIGAKMAFGPFYVNGQFSYGENLGDFGCTLDVPTTLKAASYNALSDDLDDAKDMLAHIVLGFKVSDLLKLEGGVAMNKTKKDFAVANLSLKNTTMVYYVQAAISPVKNVFIVPELGWIDYNDLKLTGLPDTKMGTSWYFGVKWQINF